MERWAKKTNEAKMVKSNALKQAQMMQKEMEAKEEELRKRIQDEMLTAVSAQTLLQEAKKVSRFLLYLLFNQVRALPNDKTWFVKHLKFVLQAVFDHNAMFLKNFKNIPKCLASSDLPRGQTFKHCLISIFQMFHKQCFIV